MDINIIHALEKRLAQDLPGFQAQTKMAPVGNERYLDISSDHKVACVLALLFPKNDQWHLSLIERASIHPDDKHAGQISFPGGRIEQTDQNPIKAALREAQEEIGLAAESVTVLGYLEPMLTITGFRVYPIVAIINANYQAQADGVEVTEIFEAPLQLFLDQANEQNFEIIFQGKARHLKEFHWQHFRIWGATATMLINLRHKLELQT